MNDESHRTHLNSLDGQITDFLLMLKHAVHLILNLLPLANQYCFQLYKIQEIKEDTKQELNVFSIVRCVVLTSVAVENAVHIDTKYKTP